MKSSMKRSNNAKHQEGREQEQKHGESQDALAALEAHFAKNFELPVIKPVSASEGREKGRKKGEGMKVQPDNAAVNSADKRATETTTRKVEPQTIVFGGSGGTESSSNTLEAKGGWRKFMSSKVMTKTDEEKQAENLAKNRTTNKNQKTKKKGDGIEDKEGDDDDDEKQAQSNDRALSTLLSTTLFAPGGAGASSSTRSTSRPNLGHNDTLARLLELSQPSAKSQGRGLGAAMLKSQEMSKMPATIRHGMRRVEMENQEKELQRQKELGNYHHSIKGLIGKRDGLDLILGTKEKDRKKRSREKGLALGVGKFAGGTLQLSDRDVQRINSAGSGGSGSKRRRT